MLKQERLAYILHHVNLRQQVLSALLRQPLNRKADLIQKQVSFLSSFKEAFFIYPVLLCFKKITLLVKEGTLVWNAMPKGAVIKCGTCQYLQVHHLNKTNYLFVKCLPVQKADLHFCKSRYASSIIK